MIMKKIRLSFNEWQLCKDFICKDIEDDTNKPYFYFSSELTTKSTKKVKYILECDTHDNDSLNVVLYNELNIDDIWIGLNDPCPGIRIFGFIGDTFRSQCYIGLNGKMKIRNTDGHSTTYDFPLTTDEHFNLSVQMDFPFSIHECNEINQFLTENKSSLLQYSTQVEI